MKLKDKIIIAIGVFIFGLGTLLLWISIITGFWYTGK